MINANIVYTVSCDNCCISLVGDQYVLPYEGKEFCSPDCFREWLGELEHIKVKDYLTKMTTFRKNEALEKVFPVINPS